MQTTERRKAQMRAYTRKRTQDKKNAKRLAQELQKEPVIERPSIQETPTTQKRRYTALDYIFFALMTIGIIIGISGVVYGLFCVSHPYYYAY